MYGSNLFTYHNDWRDQGLTVYWFGQHPPFQIDANLGFTAAVLEMLLFSKPGFLRILPALPDQWKKGRIKVYIPELVQNVIYHGISQILK